MSHSRRFRRKKYYMISIWCFCFFRFFFYFLIHLIHLILCIFPRIQCRILHTVFGIFWFKQQKKTIIRCIDYLLEEDDIYWICLRWLLIMNSRGEGQKEIRIISFLWSQQKLNSTAVLWSLPPYRRILQVNWKYSQPSDNLNTLSSLLQYCKRKKFS